MARCLSHLHVIMRGSIAGVTYLSNQYHQIVARARTAPVQPNTLRQAIIRSAYTNASGAWQTMTDVVREAWHEYSQTCLWPGPLGDYTVPGRQIFMGGRTLQVYILSRGLAVPSIVTTPPVTPGFLTPSNVNMTPFLPPGATGCALTVSADLIDDTLVYVQRSRSFNPTRMRFKGPFWGTFDQAAIVPSAATVTITFDGLEDGKAYFFRVKCVADDASPRISPVYYLRGIAKTNP